jgi:hypothetical protein
MLRKRYWGVYGAMITVYAIHMLAAAAARRRI